MIVTDDDFVDHAQPFQNRFFVNVWNRRSTLFVVPEYVFRGKANRQVISERSSFFEKLKMAGVNNVITTGNKNAFHGVSIEFELLKYHWHRTGNSRIVAHNTRATIYLSSVRIASTEVTEVTSSSKLTSTSYILCCRSINAILPFFGTGFEKKVDPYHGHHRSRNSTRGIVLLDPESRAE